MVESPNDLLDTKKIVTGIISRTVDAILSPVEGKIRRGLASTKNKSKTLLEEYLSGKLAHCRSVKSLVHVHAPVDIRRIYVPCTLIYNEHEMPEEKFLQSLKTLPKVVIVATAGAGKSSFLRHSFISHLENNQLGVPLYLELRAINESSKPIIDQILHEIALSDKKFMAEQLDLGMRRGLFTLMLDGFDEVKPSLSRRVQTEINEIARLYPLLRIMVTTRPGDGPASWGQFFMAQIAPLRFEQTRQLISRSGIAPTTVKSFLDILTPDFYNKYEHFLSVPLLSLIMALIYRGHRDFSSSIGVFYEDAFSALISRHDATKEHTREFWSGLERDDLRAIVDAFSARLYGKSSYEFSDDQALECLKDVRSSIQLDFSGSSVLKDFETSVCILLRDGFRLKFVHRTFQEYFCACFVSRLNAESARRILSKIGARQDGADLLRFVKAINNDQFETEWLLPELELVANSKLGSEELEHTNWERLECLVALSLDRQGAALSVETKSAGRLLNHCDRLGIAEVELLLNEIEHRVREVHKDTFDERKKLGRSRSQSSEHMSLGDLKTAVNGDKKMENVTLVIGGRIRDTLATVKQKRRTRDSAVSSMFEV